MSVGRRVSGRILLYMAVAVMSLTAGPRPPEAVEVGETAPDFTLPSTFGRDISLREFRGQKFVLLEFYGADFVPT